MKENFFILRTESKNGVDNHLRLFLLLFLWLISSIIMVKPVVASASYRLPSGDFEDPPDIIEEVVPESSEDSGVKSLLRSVKNAVLSTGVSTGEHYDYLSSEEKAIYRAIYTAVTTKKYIPYSKNYDSLSDVQKANLRSEYRFTYSSTMSEISSTDFGKYYNRAAEACYFDHPDMVELYMCFALTRGGSGNNSFIVLKSYYDDTKYETLDKQVNDALKERIAEIKTKNLVSTYDALTELNVHDYYADLITYDTGCVSKTGSEAYFDLAHTAWGSLYENEAVCDGYSVGFDMILEELGIDAMVIAGKGNSGGHAWNIVKVGKNWYEVDTTWAKPVGSSSVQHAFFNRTTDEYAAGLKTDTGYSLNYHVRTSDGAYCGFRMPVAKGKTYTYSVIKAGNLAAVVDVSEDLNEEISEEKTTTADNNTQEQTDNASSDTENVVIEKSVIGTTQTVGNISYEVTASDTAAVSSVLSQKATVTLPAAVIIDGKEYSVTSIADNAFKGNQKITTLKGGNNLETIGKYAFSGCKKLKKIKLTSSKLTSIQAGAFKNCRNVNEITINGNNLKSVGGSAFSGTGNGVKVKVKIKASNKKSYNNTVKLLKKKGLKKADFTRKK